MSTTTNETTAPEKKEAQQAIPKKKGMARMKSSKWFIPVALSIILLSSASAFLFWRISSTRVTTDNAYVTASTISLAPENADILQKILVNVGDRIDADSVVAQVGNELIKTKVAGVITSTNQYIGKLIGKSEAVVSMIDPLELRIEGRIDEDKGISDVKIGQRAEFTVDAFGSKKFEGVVDEISPISREGDVVFNISDKRETKQFDVKVRFNINKYPELKDGMSAKLTIYK